MKVSVIAFIVMLACAILARVSGYFYSTTATDVVYMSTALPAVLYYLSVIFDILLMFVGYGVSVYYVVTCGIVKGLLPIVFSLISVASGYAMIYLFNYIEHISFDPGAMILYLLANYATEVARFVLIMLIAVLVACAFRRGDRTWHIYGLAPLSSPVNAALFVASVIVVLSKAVVELVGTTIPFFQTYSNITSYEIGTIVVAYLLIVFIGIFGYFISHISVICIAHSVGVPDARKCQATTLGADEN